MADLHGVERGAAVIAVPPVIRPDLNVFETATRVGRGPERKRQREDAHRRGRVTALGLRRHTCRPDVGGYAGLDRLPARGAALVDIHFRGRTAGADYRNHLSGIADRGRKPRCADCTPLRSCRHGYNGCAHRSAQ